MTAPTISTEGLRELLERGAPVTVLDVRPPAERAEWSIPGSVHADAYEALRRGDPTALADFRLSDERAGPVHWRHAVPNGRRPPGPRGVTRAGAQPGSRAPCVLATPGRIAAGDPRPACSYERARAVRRAAHQRDARESPGADVAPARDRGSVREPDPHSAPANTAEPSPHRRPERSRHVA